MNYEEKEIYKSLVKLYKNKILEIEYLYKYWDNLDESKYCEHPNDCTECPYHEHYLLEQYHEIDCSCKLNSKINTCASQVPEECPFILF